MIARLRTSAGVSSFIAVRILGGPDGHCFQADRANRRLFIQFASAFISLLAPTANIFSEAAWERQQRAVASHSRAYVGGNRDPSDNNGNGSERWRHSLRPQLRERSRLLRSLHRRPGAHSARRTAKPMRVRKFAGLSCKRQGKGRRNLLPADSRAQRAGPIRQSPFFKPNASVGLVARRISRRHIRSHTHKGDSIF